MCGLLPCVLPASMSPSHWADSDSLLGQTALPQPLPTNSVPPNGFCPRVFRERQEMTTVESPCLSSGVSGLQGHKLTRCLFFPFLVPVDSYADNSSMPFGHNIRQMQMQMQTFRSSSVIKGPETAFCPKSCLGSVIKLCSTVSS